MPIVGISRLGVGKTTDTGSNLLMNLDVTQGSTNVGTGRSFFEISKFQIAREGHSFAIGDKFTPVGLVVDKRLQKPLDRFELEVVNTFNDFFSAWQFGELDFIDDIAQLQTGSRKRFPLFRNGQLLSFEVDEESPLGESIDLNAVLVIFVNGVLQTPNYAYQFEGGTTFQFTEGFLQQKIRLMYSSIKVLTVLMFKLLTSMKLLKLVMILELEEVILKLTLKNRLLTE